MAAGFAYAKLGNPNAALIAAGISAGYYAAGHYITRGDNRFGYDLASITSLGLLAAVGPRAYRSGEMYSTVR